MREFKRKVKNDLKLNSHTGDICFNAVSSTEHFSFAW
jgi:hypothetical protein